MTNQQILEKAIKKALDNGWANSQEYSIHLDHLDTLDHEYVDSSGLIFNHDFAKALWGEKNRGIVKVPGDLYAPLLWQYHLQQMVIADDPIKYLGGYQ